MRFLLILIAIFSIALIITLLITIFGTKSNETTIINFDYNSKTNIDSNKTKYIGNFHTHTGCSDGENTYDEMITEAAKLGFDFIAITDHEICPENQKLCANEKRILCIPSQEVSTDNGHILAINIFDEISDDLSIENTINEIHKQGGIAIAAHPLRKGDIIDESKLKLFDAIECNHPDYDEKEIVESKELIKKYNLKCTYDSDAHSKENLNNLYDTCYMPKLDVNNIKIAIKEGKCYSS